PRKPGRMEMPRTAPTQKSGYLGVMLEPQSDGQPSIGRITEGSPAEKAGLQQGDVVLSVDGRTVRNVEKLIATIQGFKPGAVVAIKVQRGDEKLLLSPKLGRFPVDILSRGERMNMMGGELSHRLGGFPVILQHDLQIKPQDCGGPVVNLDGKAIGINIARAGRTESYAIPSDEVLKLLPEMINGRYVVTDDHQEERLGKLETTLANLKEEVRKVQQKLRDLPDSTSEKKRKDLKKNLDDLKAEMKGIYEELETLKPEKKAP
ncbi:MAG: PDZ domain-containing protein, partial [Gemmataceae bacterium]